MQRIKITVFVLLISWVGRAHALENIWELGFSDQVVCALGKSNLVDFYWDRNKSLAKVNHAELEGMNCDSTYEYTSSKTADLIRLKGNCHRSNTFLKPVGYEIEISLEKSNSNKRKNFSQKIKFTGNRKNPGIQCNVLSRCDRLALLQSEKAKRFESIQMPKNSSDGIRSKMIEDWKVRSSLLNVEPHWLRLASKNIKKDNQFLQRIENIIKSEEALVESFRSKASNAQEIDKIVKEKELEVKNETKALSEDIEVLRALREGSGCN